MTGMVDIQWIVVGHRLRLGDHEYVLVDDYERLRDSIADLTRRHNNLNVNILRRKLKDGKRLKAGERKRVSRATVDDEARKDLQTYLANLGMQA